MKKKEKKLPRGGILSFSSRRRLSNSRAFSLVELMVAMATIGILVGIAVPVYFHQKQKSNDKARLATMKNIQDAIEAYRLDNGCFPPFLSDVAPYYHSGWDGEADGVFIKGLHDAGYLNKVVKDPSGHMPHVSGNYDYYCYNAASYGADANRGKFFVLGVRDMESTGNPHPDSPGWSTPGRDWQTEFDWVVGGFEY